MKNATLLLTGLMMAASCGHGAAPAPAGPPGILREFEANGLRGVDERLADGKLRRREFNKDGVLMMEGELRAPDGRSPIVENRPAGEWKYWNPDGTMASREIYDDSGWRTRWEFWRHDGKLESVRMLKNDSEHGLCCFWNADGTLDAETSGLYEDGKRVAPCPDGACDRVTAVPERRP